MFHGITAILLGGVFLFAYLILPSPAVGQDSSQQGLQGMSLEDLAKLKIDSVYGASKFLESAAHAPGSVTVITGEQIQAYGFRTLADLLRTVRGFYVINDRNYSFVGVRGFSRPGDYNARILFLLDGHRVNDNIFDGAYVGTEFPIDVDLIDRVEIIRGPSSSVYGTGALVAVINVITKRGRDLTAVEGSAETASWHSYKGRATYGDRFENGLETLASGSFLHSAGHPQLFFPEFASPATNNGFAQNADADQSYNLFADIIYRDFNIHVVQGSRTKHIPTASFGTVFNDSRTRTTDARGYVDVQYQHALGSWQVLGRASYDWYDYHGIYVYDYSGLGTPPFTQNYDAANGTWWDFQGDVSRTFLARHKVTLGTELRRDLQQRQVNYDIQPYHLYLDDHRSALLSAFYAQDEYSLRKNLTLLAALRADWHDNYNATLSPRAGLVFNPAPGTDLKAFYSRAFRSPNSYESFYGTNTSTANPSLVPETMHSWEVDVDQRFKRSYFLSAAAYLNRINNLIEQRIDAITGNPVYVNTSAVQTRGIEWELGARWPGGVETSLAHSLQDSRNVVTRDVLTNSPKQIVQFNLTAPVVRRKLFIGMDAQNVSRRRTIQQTDLGSFFIANINLFTRKLTDRFDVSASLYNVFDKRYADSGSINHVQASIPEDGRSFRVKLTYRPHLARK